MSENSGVAVCATVIDNNHQQKGAAIIAAPNSQSNWNFAFSCGIRPQLSCALTRRRG